MAEFSTQNASPLFLEVAGDELDGTLHEVTANGLLVGRSPICDVQFESREVSRRHAYFYPDGAACSVKDLGARNGILVNGRPVREHRLEPGDVVDVGPSRFTLATEAMSPTAAPVVRRPAARTPPPGPPGAVLGPAALRPLMLATPIFGVLACLHWAFGLGAVVLGMLALWEMEDTKSAMGRPLVIAGLLMGLAGAGMHGWFGEFAPRIRERQWRAARLECRDNLVRLGVALDAYSLEYGVAMPAGMDALAEEGLVTPEMLNCPGCQVVDGRLCGYFFPAGGRAAVDAADVVACDPDLRCHQQEGGWVLHGDGRVEWLRQGRFAHVLHRLAGRPERLERGED